MIPSNADSASAELPQKKHMISDWGAPGPMPQQDAAGSHGHEMHPQKLVQLVGCHDQNAGKHEVPIVCTNFAVSGLPLVGLRNCAADKAIGAEV